MIRPPFVFCLLFAAACAGPARKDPAPAQRLVYPEAKQVDQVDVYHGVAVRDPYRWLEDIDSADTHAWIEAENRVTRKYLSRIPARDVIRRRLEQLADYERYGIPLVDGGHYFFRHNTGLQNQSVLYTSDSLHGRDRVLLDPNPLSKDGTVALNGIYPSRDGKLLCYGLSRAGSDWVEYRVRDTATGKDLSDDLRWIKFSGASWSPDGSGFYYNRYPEPKPGKNLKQVNRFQKVYFHRIGTPQKEDRLVYDRPDKPDWGFGTDVSEDGRYLVLSVWKGSSSQNAVLYKDLEVGSKAVPLLPDFDADYGFLGNDGPVFWFYTDKDAERGRIVAIDVRHPQPAAWKTVVPQGEDAMDDVSLVGDRFVVVTLHNAHSVVSLYKLDGTFEKEIPLPQMGSVYGFRGRRSQKETFFEFTSFTVPPRIYRYDFSTGETSLFRKPAFHASLEGLTVRQVFFPSRDGTKIPMFLAYRKGVGEKGHRPTYLYGYGGFRISLKPYFSVSKLVWMEMGGIYAVANLRGGGEFGEAWHRAGMLHNKQNVFDDFQAAAQWLVASGYTTPDRLAIAGSSNGGLLVGACLTQRPELYGAALPDVGVLDMLRFPKFTIGYAWVSEYGSPDKPADFKVLYAYSPLHNIKPGTRYPATFITTADHDDRVFPAHSFKFAAAMQAAQAGPAPILIRVETKAGHGGGKPMKKWMDETADSYAFLVKALHMTLPSGFGR